PPRRRPNGCASCTSASSRRRGSTPGEGRDPRGRLGASEREPLSEATTTTTRRLSLAPDVDLGELLGRNDDHLRTLESELDVRIVARGHDIMLKGDERQVRRAERAITQLAELQRSGAPV